MATDPLQALLERARGSPPATVAVVQPTDANALGGALEALKEGFATPILVGDEARIRAAAAQIGASLEGLRIEHVPGGDLAAAAWAVALVRGGEASVLMKGYLHTDDLMRAVLDREQGLRTGRRLSHVFVCCMPASTYPRPLMITDGALNVAPDLETKRHITQNAIDLARALGVEVPKVAVLAAVETVNPAMPASVEAAALSKMADRGQIVGGLVDGPLAFDNAISAEAARTKGITSPVAGAPDVLVVPDIEAGNIAFKQLAYLAGATTPGIVLGARAPVLLTSRADPPLARLASCAIALQVVRYAAGGP